MTSTERHSTDSRVTDPRTPAPPLLTASLVGRQEQLGEMMDALARALAEREPRVLTVLAPSGLGKTRLFDEFVKEAARTHGDGQLRILRGRIHPTGPAVGIIGRMLKARFGMHSIHRAEDREAHLRQSVAQVLGDQRVSEFLHFLGGYLDIRFSESPLTHAMEDDPQPLAQVRRAVLRRFLEIDAAETPLVLLFDDVTGAPDELLELLKYLATTLRGAPILLAFAARDELLTDHPGWAGGANHDVIRMPPLSDEEAKRLVREFLARGGAVPDELVEAVVRAAGGSPYLVRETLRTYFDEGVLVAEPSGRFRVDQARVGRVTLPTSVEQARDHRLSGLSALELELLTKAACVGDVFWLDALVALEHRDHAPPDLWGGHESRTTDYGPTLERLAQREFITASSEPLVSGALEYAFCQRAEWEALLARVPAAQLAQSHATVADWLEFRLAPTERDEAQLELLATHHQAGGHVEDAARYWVEAGALARARNATEHAVNYYSRGVPLLRETDVRRRLDALHDYGDVLQRLGDYDEAIRCFREMLAIAYRLGLKAKGGVAHNRIGRVHRAAGRLDEALRHLGTGHALFDAVSDARGIAASFDDVGRVHLLRGDYSAARRFAHRSLELRRELGDPRSVALSLDNLGAAYLASGAFERATEALEEALVLRRQIGDEGGIAASLTNLGRVHRDNGQHARAQELFEQALHASRAAGDRALEAQVLTLLGEGHYRLVDPEAAISLLTEADQLATRIGDKLLEGAVRRGLAQAQLLMQEPEVARHHIEKAIALFEGARSQPALARALVTRGEIEASAGELRRAQAAFEEALEILEGVGDELGIADACSAYATFAAGASSLGVDSEALAMRARRIRERLRASEDYVIEPLEPVS
ncbi:MAG: tetratricopeptide repeat protein [Sandaracinaceae bacterium]|nr:tetratricopeptide repeat protein [Sandaracinaceae bacterium]